jgi:hypothetical protein
LAVGSQCRARRGNPSLVAPGDGLDELAVPKVQRRKVVGCPSGRQRSRVHKPAKERPPLGVRVVVRTGRAGKKTEAIRQRADRRAERVRGRAFKPAVHARGDTAQHSTALVRRSQQRVETVKPPDGEQVGSRTAGNPEHVLVIHKGFEVLDDAIEQGQLGRTAVVALIAR